MAQKQIARRRKRRKILSPLEAYMKAMVLIRDFRRRLGDRIVFIKPILDSEREKKLIDELRRRDMVYIKYVPNEYILVRTPLPDTDYPVRVMGGITRRATIDKFRRVLEITENKIKSGFYKGAVVTVVY